MPKLLLPSTGNTDANSTAGGGRSGPAPHWPGPLDEERPGACAAGPSTPWLPPRSDRLSCSPTPSPRVRPGACRRPVAAALAEARRSNGRQRARWTGVHGFLQPASGPNCTVQIRSHAPTRRSSGGPGKKGRGSRHRPLSFRPESRPGGRAQDQFSRVDRASADEIVAGSSDRSFCWRSMCPLGFEIKV